MRLSPDQIQSIRYAATATFGQGTAVWLFGSRVDDTKKGGDIDLLVRPTPAEADRVGGACHRHPASMSACWSLPKLRGSC